MRVSLVQSSPIRRDVNASLNALDVIIGDGTSADLYVLPEMFASGQCVDPIPVAQDMEGSIVSWMKATAGRLDAAVAGSVAIEEDGHYYNRLCFARPDGTVITYDKRHLFTYSGENMHFSAGNERIITEFRGVRILLQVCYDLRFPVFSRNRDDYDMILYVANWPLKRQNSWDVFLRARAMENQCYVAGTNCVGDDEYGHYEGHSALIGPYGETIIQAENDAEQIVTEEIDMDKLRHFREKFPVLDDADEWIMNN